MLPVNEDFKWMALYQLKGSKQVYIDNVILENGKFSIEIPENTPVGMYRLRYKMDNESFVDFIYTNENVEVQIDASNASESVKFLTSEENILYANYLNETTELKEQLSAIQYSYFSLKTEDEKNSSAKLYEIYLLKYTETQQQFEENSVGKLANHFIKAGKKYYASHLIENPQEYLNSEKSHFFEYINFQDETLINSTFISQNVLDYVFYLNVSEDIEVQNMLYKNAINEVFDKLNDNNQLKSELVTSLLYAFSNIENLTIVDYIQENYYDTLPTEYKNDADIKTLLEHLKTAIGRTAPDFSWEENGKTKSLHQINGAETYILVFWSTSCSHCLNEIPKLYDYLKENTKVHVIGIALENNATEFNKYKVKLENWTNVLGLGKWENPIAINYSIVSTPTYFILDANKIIVAKPELFEDVKAYFEE